MALGENIRQARKVKGLTQKGLAEAVESDPSYVNRVETGKANPSIAVLERIADALECSLDYLVKGEGEDLGSHVADQTVAERIRLVDALDEEDRSALLHVIDTMVTKKRMRELLTGEASRAGA